MKEGYFSKIVVGWYEAFHRDLPWRKSQDPYKIWLSEIILQQTRVAQGLPYYERILGVHPNVSSLAQASERDILRLWQGLGYYSRARNLHRCAKEVAQAPGAKFPSTYETLKELPGIGDYTAAAIASFAFNQPVAVVDGNVYRVLSRIFGLHHDIAKPAGKRLFAQLANELISKDKPGKHNQAVMEFGALQCLPRNPKCGDCPFSKLCIARIRDLQADLPFKSVKPKAKKRFFHYIIIRHGSSMLMKRRSEKDIWHGLYDFHLIESKSRRKTETMVKASEWFQPGTRIAVSRSVRHLLTHQELFVAFAEIEIKTSQEFDRLARELGLQSYSYKHIESLPKPILIHQYLVKHHSIVVA
jgi:A/G-specific adenine glycosylase